MSQQVKVNLYRTILAFALADVALGVAALFCELFPLQLSALIVTTITLVLSVVFTILYPRNKRSDIVMIVVGSLDFMTTLISLLVIVMATQLLAVVASSFTLLKAVKIFVQSEKARRLLDTTKPFLLKLAQRLAPAFGVWLVSKKKYLKNKIKGDSVMEKVKEFFVKLGQEIRANKVCLGASLVNGGGWAVLGWLVDSVESIAIDVAGFNITPLFSILGFVVIELAMQWEKFGDFIVRISPKLEKRLIKRKEQELLKEQKNAEKEHEKLIAQMKAEKAAEEKAAREAEELKAKKEKEEAERIQKEQEEKELAEWLAKKQAEAQKAEAEKVAAEKAE